MDVEWYQNTGKVNEVAHFLVDESEITTVQELLDFYEKPWHYEEHYQWYKAVTRERAKSESEE